MVEDKTTIGMTPGNNLIMESIMGKNWFIDQIHAAKFAMSLAISSNIPPGEIKGTDTIWNIGSFDRGGELKNLITAIFPEKEKPYRLIEYYLNKGLSIIGEKLKKDGDIYIDKLLSL